MKMSGTVCGGQTGKSMQVYRTGTDNTALEIAVSNKADANNSYTSADRIDDNTSGTKAPVFGVAGAQVTEDILYDGSDADGTVNGDIVSGGGLTTESSGASELHVVFDAINSDGTAQVDNTTWEMSPQS